MIPTDPASGDPNGFPGVHPGIGIGAGAANLDVHAVWRLPTTGITRLAEVIDPTRFG